MSYQMPKKKKLLMSQSGHLLWCKIQVQYSLVQQRLQNKLKTVNSIQESTLNKQIDDANPRN